MPEIFVGIGSNVEPEIHVARSLEALGDAFGPLAVSPVYRNPAVGFEGDDFLNLVVAFSSTLPVDRLVEKLRQVERECGRTRSERRWGPRTLDLDLLLYGDRVCKEPPLPRADVLKRAFVLRPLAEIAADRRHPVSGRTFLEHWRAFKGSGGKLERVELPEPGVKKMSNSVMRIFGEKSDEELS